MTLTIAEAGQGDLDQLVALSLQVQDHHVALYPRDFHADPDKPAIRAMFQRILRVESQMVLIARDDAAPAGYIWYEELAGHDGTYSQAHPRLYVHHIGVAPDVRRQGIARRLMNRAIAEAGTRDIVLDSWARNDAAHAFFRSIGFRPMRVTFRRQGGVGR